MSYRFHVLGLPQCGTMKKYSACGFIPAIMNFCRMMKELGHTVILYTSDENEAPCDEAVQICTAEEQRKWLVDPKTGNPIHFVFAPFEAEYAMWAETNKRMVEEIKKRMRPHDFVCTIGGQSQKAVGDGLQGCGLQIVEYMVGYKGTFAPFCVYASHSWRQYLYGKYDSPDGCFFDAVIPLYYDPAEFALSTKKKDYLLYCGRMTPRKGIAVAVDTSSRSGLPLKLIGPGAPPPELNTKHCEFIGEVSVEMRNHLMGEARAVMMPTLYNEPFGSVAIEANLCGTPVISTDTGAFPEIIQNGVNGYRANLLREFVAAVHQCAKLDPQKIRDHAVARYSFEVVKPQYQAYFDRLSTLWDKGWYAE